MRHTFQPMTGVTRSIFASRSQLHFQVSSKYTRFPRQRIQQSILKPSRQYATSSAQGNSSVSWLKNVFFGTSLLLGFGIVYVYVTDTRASVHRWIVIPALRVIYRDPEEAHHVGNQTLKTLWRAGLHPRERDTSDNDRDLVVEVFGHTLLNPIATSAGIDKGAEIPDPLFAIGPSIVEIGGATPLPQPGNAKPRVFRLTNQQAMINRYGLNSEGADSVAARLRHRVREFAYSMGLGHDEIAEQHVLNGHAGVPPGSLKQGKLLAVNIAKNKDTPGDDVEAITNDYVYCVQRLGPYADILVVNVSSPNTPGLRSLQQGETLKRILTGVVQAAKATDRLTKPAVMVKVSPDEDSDDQVLGICEAVWASGVDGVIVGNTTNQRPASLPYLPDLSLADQQNLLQTGGFSGPHLFPKTVAMVKKYKKLLTEKPEEFRTPTVSRSALEAEANKIKQELKVNDDPVKTSVDTGVVPFPTASRKEDAKESEAEETNEELKEANHERLKSIQAALERLPPKAERDRDDQPKVIFATGGITNGKQALEVLNAGASVAMIYTALVYGGAGTVSRIKKEMRDEIQAQKDNRQLK